MKEKLMKTGILLLLSAVFLPLTAQEAPAAAPAENTAETAAPAVEAEPKVKVDPIPAEVAKNTVRKEFAVILSAEITAEKKPQVNDHNPHDDSPFKDDTCWAQLILLLPEKRTLSRFDFVLKFDNEVYPCLAVAVGDDPYSMNDDAWTLPADRDVNTPVRLLFAVSQKRIQGNDGSSLVSLRLERTFTGITTSIGADQLLFRRMPAENDLTSADAAKKYAMEKGYSSYGKTYAEMIAPPPQPQPATTAEAPATDAAATPAETAAPAGGDAVPTATVTP